MRYVRLSIGEKKENVNRKRYIQGQTADIKEY